MQTNVIHCGNHLDVLKEYPDGCFDMFLTSPPYDNLRDYEGYDFQFEPLARELYRVLKSGGVGVWIVNDATIDGSETLTSAKQKIFFREIGFNIWDTMIYARQSAYPANDRYSQDFEYSFILAKGKPLTFNPLYDHKGDTSKNGSPAGRERKRSALKPRDNKAIERVLLARKNELKVKSNVWFFQRGFMHSSKDRISFEHPATFPEKLAEDHILSWSNPGDVVLDPMCGSGTTCKMAVKHGRQYVGIDIAEKYCDIARNRIDKFTAQATIFDAVGYNNALHGTQARSPQLSLN